MKFLLDLLKSLTGQPGGIGASVSMTPPTFAPAIPQRPPVLPQPSPNFRRTPGRRPTCVIIHATAGELAGAIATLCDPRPTDPKSRVSAHYLVGRDGSIFQLVHEEDVAWHAGQSFWQGRPNVNDFSVGLELVNRNDGVDPYSEAQLAATAQLVKAICAENGIMPHDVIGHCDIAPGRKTDPGTAFPWIDFRARLA